jgi:hypothetical protein
VTPADVCPAPAKTADEAAMAAIAKKYTSECFIMVGDVMRCGLILAGRRKERC